MTLWIQVPAGASDWYDAGGDMALKQNVATGYGLDPSIHLSFAATIGHRHQHRPYPW